MRFFIGVILVFFVITAVLSIIRGAFSADSSPGPAARNSPLRPTTPNRLVKDPVCGTYVPEQTAIRAGEHFFCSNECKSKYLAS